MILSYKGISISYSVSGKGPTITLLHGFLENSTMWAETVTLLEKTNQVITIDLLGHGKTDCLGYVHTMENFADIVDAILQNLNITTTTIIGHSLGGYVALAFAEKRTEMVDGLCLMNSTPFSDSKERLKLRDRAITIAKTNYENLITMSISNLFFEDNRIKFKTEIEHIKSEALKTPLQGYVATQQGMKTRKDRSELLANLTCKKLIITGKKDPILPKNNIKKLKKIQTLEICVLNGGHMSYIENKDEYQNKVMHFVEKI